MPTAVLDLDLSELPVEISVEKRYQHALILMRLNGEPVGQTIVALGGEWLSGSGLRDTLIGSARWPVWRRRLQSYLGWEHRDSRLELPKASVVVCTRDHPDDLFRCLGGILRLPDDGQEILVVDNCPSSDETQRVAASFAGVRYVQEERPGLDIARNRAFREARHEVVAFIDDDAVPDPGWLRGLLQDFEDPHVLCVTGLTMPLELETQAQEWFERYSSFKRGFDRRVFDRTKIDPKSAGAVGSGSNMAFRRNAPDRVGFFDELLDGGTASRSGGDAEMFSRVLTAGYRIVYEPAALAWHRHRHTRAQVRGQLYGYGVGMCAHLTKWLVLRRDWRAFRVLLHWLFEDPFSALLRWLVRHPERVPPDLVLAQLLGCSVGPWAYLFSRIRAR